MAIGFRTPQTPVEQAANSSPTSVSFPAGTVAGDVLLLKCATGGSSTSNVSTPGGWTQIAQISNTGNTLAPNVSAFIRVCDGTEGGAVSVTHGVLFSAQVLAYTGVDNVTPQDVAAVVADITSAGTGVPFPAITIATTGAALSYVISGNSTTITATPASSPAAFTEDADRTVASSRGWEVGHLLNVSAGTIAANTISPTWSGSVRSVGILIALRPASTGAAATGTASLDLVASGTAAAPVTGTGALSLVASGTAQAPDTGTAALALNATGSASASPTGTGAVSLVATGTARAAVTGSAAVDLVATGSATGPGSTGTAALTLAATGNARAAASGSAAVTLVASGSAQAPATGTGALSLVASGTAAARGAGSAVLSLLGQGAAAARAVGTALLSLVASGTAQAGGVSSPSAYAVAHQQIRRVVAGEQARKASAHVLARAVADEQPRKILADVRPRSIPATTRRA